jgi:hypothetical protein
MTALAKKSILARLLARENITVEQTNHHTAFFDVERRILGLPYFKDVGNDLYDLLVGHEIGHALHTPADGWHSSTTDIPGCPRSYVNIVEDIRIEKLVLREFPGLLGAFMRGYQDLLDRDFFGIKDEDVNKLSFMNRLNIFAKSRGLVEVKFNAKEQPYLDRAMAVETWEDVINSCRELYEFMKEELEAARKAEEEMAALAKALGIEPTMGIPDKIIIKAGNGTSESVETSEMSEELKEAIMNGEVEIEVDVESFEKAAAESNEEDSKDSGIPISTVGDSETADAVETDAMFRAAIRNSLVDTIGAGGKTVYAKGPTKGMANAVTASYEKVAKLRRLPVGDQFPQKRYVRFNAGMKDVVSVMVKEFEMKKTARRFARARTSTKGSLDVNALHRYKYDDHLFKQVTHLDDDQSHGMIMLVDYSSSMSSVIQKVLKQVMVLVTFCKRVNIPFEVYGFTNPSYSSVDSESSSLKAKNKHSLTHVFMENVHVFKLIDSSMKKSTYEEAYRALFMQITSKKWMGGAEQMSGTPLDQAILAMYHHIAEFRTKHNVQKMNFITLTDGDGEGLRVANGIDLPNGTSANSAQKRVVDILGQKITLGGYRQTTPALLDGLRKIGVRTMNYHLISAGGIVYSADELRNANDEVKKAAVAKMKKDGYYVVDDKNGYDRQIFTALTVSDHVSSNQDDAEEDDVEVDISNFAEDFTAKSFKKKRDRLVATKFAEVVS